MRIVWNQFSCLWKYYCSYFWEFVTMCRNLEIFIWDIWLFVLLQIRVFFLDVLDPCTVEKVETKIVRKVNGDHEKVQSVTERPTSFSVAQYISRISCFVLHRVYVERKKIDIWNVKLLLNQIRYKINNLNEYAIHCYQLLTLLKLFYLQQWMFGNSGY